MYLMQIYLYKSRKQKKALLKISKAFTKYVGDPDGTRTRDHLRDRQVF